MRCTEVDGSEDNSMVDAMGSPGLLLVVGAIFSRTCCFMVKSKESALRKPHLIKVTPVYRVILDSVRIDKRQTDRKYFTLKSNSYSNGRDQSVQVGCRKCRRISKRRVRGILATFVWSVPYPMRTKVTKATKYLRLSASKTSPLYAY